MTARSTKSAGSRAGSKTTVKATELASVSPKAATNDAAKLLGQRSARTATAGKTVRKAAGMTAGSPRTPGPGARAKTAAKALEMASIPAKTAANEAANLVEMASTATAAGAVIAEEATLTKHSTKTSAPLARSKTAAKIVELASIRTKTAVHNAVTLVAETSKETVAASEIAKKETVHAIDTYQAAATEALDTTEDIVKVGDELIGGITEIHQTMLSAAHRLFQAAGEMPAQFAACTSFTDLAQIHRAVVRRGFAECLNISQEMLMWNRRITDRAIHAWEIR